VKEFRVESAGSFPVITPDSTIILDEEFDAVNLSLLGGYHNAVYAALYRGQTEQLLQFRHTVLYNVSGTSYQLLTNVNALYLLFERLTEQERHDFDRAFNSRRRVIYAAP
jgi:hypothetical protein